MDLRALIGAIDGWREKSAGELAELLNTPSIEVVDTQLYTWAGIALVIGPQGAEGFRLALEANGMGWVVHQLGGSGLQLSNPLCQQVLLAFAAGGLPGAAELAASGIHRLSPYGRAGGDGEVTEKEIQPVLAAVQLETQKQELMSGGAQVWNTFVAAVDGWDGTGEAPRLGN